MAFIKCRWACCISSAVAVTMYALNSKYKFLQIHKKSKCTILFIIKNECMQHVDMKADFRITKLLAERFLLSQMTKLISIAMESSLP